ncbi:MAG: hypothetical protein IPL46_06065 [Saprospiraceae bacterium]|nr:hypothetical protein [Saprospiraceae bacterium]
MHRLLYIVLIGICAGGALLAQSPHGELFTMDCINCHSSSSWKLDYEIYSFQHDTTDFALTGQHQLVDCKSCHSSLIFSQAQSNCSSCHADMHNQTVGFDCARCHDDGSWLVQNITDIHQQNGFPLQGVHAVVNCNECHQNSEVLRFDPIGNECIICHSSDYEATTKPNHRKAGYSKDCSECHNISSFEWASSGFNHDFFPLTEGHEINECASCHKGADYVDISAECVSCHQGDFNATVNPDHRATGFGINCVECHTTSIRWQPAEFKDHDAEFFPIYSGTHHGSWNQCAECHTQEGNFASFTCTTCHDHNQQAMDESHIDIGGYSYNSPACLACHATGESENAFDHSATNFQLTGAHITVECLECHGNGFAGTPTNCFDCHTADFNESLNPDHQTLGFPTDCSSCHSTAPDWKPASLPNHNEYYALNGAHASIAADCISCHNGNYTETSNTCSACHVDDYNATSNPPHEKTAFSTDCASCHSESSWRPAEFEHDQSYFPVYTGKHQGTWNECIECHTAGNYSAYSCIECHEHNKVDTDTKHEGISGYNYSSEACLACHPVGSADGAFDHNATNFPLTGAHTTVECASCHINGYAGTSTLCVDCHTIDFNQTTNPNHAAIGISNDCASCHTTEPNWSPATFVVHNDYYVIEGAHTALTNDCAACHNGDYINTPNTCAGCHIDNYNATTNPNHLTAGYSTDCATCHTQAAWQPANFDHNLTNFPLTGAHTTVECASCHINGYAGTSTLCVDCHTIDFNQTTNPNHAAIGISNDCASCHTTEPNWSPATFAVHNDYYVIEGPTPP